MTDKELELAKAKAKSLAHHFKKMAAHHEAKMGHHEKAAAAHEAHAEHHKEMMGKVDGEHKDHHKASAAFHKFKASHHEKMHKLHKAMHEHHKAMADAHEATESEKVYKLAGMEEEPLSTRPISQPDPAAKPVQKNDPAPATPAADPAAPSAAANINDTLSKALDTKLTEAVNAAFERVLNSEDFSKKVDNAIAGKLLEKLGSSTVPTDIRTVPVPRPGEGKPNGSGAAKTTPDFSGLDPELSDLVKID